MGRANYGGDLVHCLLQSQVAVYKAMGLALAEAQDTGRDKIEEMIDVHESKDVSEELEALILAAYEAGAISAREAESMLHPLHDHIRHLTSLMVDANKGVIHDVKAELVSGPPNGHHHGGHGTPPESPCERADVQRPDSKENCGGEQEAFDAVIPIDPP